MHEMKFKVLFVGIGSIARRHIRNLNAIGNDGLSFEVDAFRRTGLPADGVDHIYQTFEDIPDDYDIIFITNPTEYHLSTLKRYLEKGKVFFIEKPVVSIHQIEEAKTTLLRDDSLYYVACPLRYNAVIQYIKTNIDLSDVLSVRSISSSYLPDWRPGQDYRTTYSAQKALGGGVSIDLIHEWDYLTYLFGWPARVFSLIGKKSDLEIDSDDYAVYIAELDNKIIELHLDYFGRKTIREIQLFTKDDTIIGDIANNQISFMKAGKTIQFEENRDDFQKRELTHFIDMISNGQKSKDDFLHAVRVLSLTQGKIDPSM